MNTAITYTAANALTFDQLAAVFTLGYSGYFVPVNLNADQMHGHILNNDVDLSASWVAYSDHEPVGVCLLGIRGQQGWIGGLGVASTYRRYGVGRELMQRIHTTARERGLTEIMLEVLYQNIHARQLYEQLGYQVIRRLWVVESPAINEITALVSSLEVQRIQRDEALAQYDAFHTIANPWQRARESLQHLPADIPTFMAFVDDRPVAYVIAVIGTTVINLLDLGCMSGYESALRDLILHLHHQHQHPARLVNLGENETAWDVLEALRYHEVMSQWEMRLSLS